MTKKTLLKEIMSVLLMLSATTAITQESERMTVKSDEINIAGKNASLPAQVVVQPRMSQIANKGANALAVGADVLVNNNNGATSTSRFTQSETSVIAFGNNVVIGYNDAGSIATAGGHFTGWSYSSDGGVTFTDGGTLPNSAAGDAGDPVLVRNNTTGRIYFITLGFNNPNVIQVFHSDNNGVSWSAPVNGTPGGSIEDKPWVEVDNFAGSGNGNIYLLSRRFGAGGGIYFFRSTDNGATFGPTGGTLIVSGLQGAYIAVGPDHSVYAFYWAGTSLRMRRSTDQGLTFSAPVIVATLIGGGTNGDLGLTGIRNGLGTPSAFRSSKFPHAAVNPVSGHIYVTYPNNPAGPDKTDVFYVLSTDNGATWSAPVKINDDATTTDQWQPTVAVSPNGQQIGFFYYSRQEDAANNNLFKYYGRTGIVCGATVTLDPSFAVSNVASFPEFGRDGAVNLTYMGDYNTVSATATDFHVVWSDNRDDLSGGSPRKDPNVYYKKINLPVLQLPACSITSVPANNVYTGGVPTNIYLGYGPQSTTLQVSAPASGAPYTYSWSGGTLSNYNTANPVFAPTAAGTYIFTVVVTNKYGCTGTCSITINVYDIRVPGTNGKKVYVCHSPGGNPSNAHTLAISVNAVPAHVPGHSGDRLGSCNLVIAASRNQNMVINDLPVLNRVNTYPNPNRGSFDLQLNNYKTGRAEIRILNKAGVVIERRNVQVNGNGQIIHFNLKNRSAGMYYIQIITKDGIQNSKVVINR